MGASHFKDGFRSFYDFKFYQEVASGRRTTFNTCGFFVALILLASAIAVGFVSVRVTPAMTNFNLYDFGREIQELYPKELEISLEPQVADHDVTETLPPKLTINKPYPLTIACPASLVPVARGMCGAASAGGLMTSFIRAAQRQGTSKWRYPDLSLIKFTAALPDGEYSQTKLDAMCLEHKTLFLTTETGFLMCPPQVFCEKEHESDTPSFRSSFWSFSFFDPTEKVTLDRMAFVEYVQMFIDFPLINVLFGYRMLGFLINIVMIVVAALILGTLAFWFWFGLTVSSWIGLHVLTCGRRNFPLGGVAQMAAYTLTPWAVLSVVSPSLVWWILPYVYMYFVCLFKIHFSTPPSPAAERAR